MTAAGVLPDERHERGGPPAYYASQFALVEVDATDCALPTQVLTALWVERAPPDFTFDIKHTP